MELLREHVWRTVMEFKQSQFWNAVSVAALTVVTAILYVYSAFLLSLWLLKRNKIRRNHRATVTAAHTLMQK